MPSEDTEMTKAEKKEAKRLRKLEKQKKKEKKRKLQEMQGESTEDATPDAKKCRLFLLLFWITFEMNHCYLLFVRMGKQ